MPNDKEIVEETLTRKREEYANMLNHYFGTITFDTT
jgi:hypothetical protein